MTLSIKAKLDAVMNGSFTLHAFTKTHFRQQIDRALLEHTSSNCRFYLVSAAAFEHERINPLPREQQREEQTSWASPNDSDSCSHVHNSSPRKFFVSLSRLV